MKKEKNTFVNVGKGKLISSKNTLISSQCVCLAVCTDSRPTHTPIIQHDSILFQLFQRFMESLQCAHCTSPKKTDRRTNVVD